MYSIDTIFIQCCQLLNVQITFLGVNYVMIITMVTNYINKS